MGAYRLFSQRPCSTQVDLDALVWALWRTQCRRGYGTGPNHNLDHLHPLMSTSREAAMVKLCPYYFDQVTYHLPGTRPGNNKVNCNLSCFESWADEETAGERRLRDHRGQRFPTAAVDGEPRHPTHICLSRLCVFRDAAGGESLMICQSIYQMYQYTSSLEIHHFM